MPNYITAVGQLLGSETAKLSSAVLYGENINLGSRISGLTKHLNAPEGGRLLNVGNCEATHCGAGFGMMMNGVNAVLFAKQLDFMLLGVDHFANTYNFIRCRPDSNLRGSFTIVTIICDQGLQGPQSSFNGLADICSLARVPGYTITNNQDSAHVLKHQLGKPGFRFITLGQRLFSEEFTSLELVYASEDSSLFQYAEGDAVTIVCFNFSLPHGLELSRKCLARGMTSSLFSANYVPGADWARIRASAGKTKRLVVIDDSKSVHLPGHALLHEVGQVFPDCKRFALMRVGEPEFGVCSDRMDIDFDAVLSQLSAHAAK